MRPVFVHGAGSSGLPFYYQLRHFRLSNAIDLPGHPTGNPCISIDAYLEWVRGFITALRYEDVVLIGHSMGAAITLRYALRYPEDLRGIILICTGARLRVHLDYLGRSRQRLPRSSIKARMLFKSLLGTLPIASERRRHSRIRPIWSRTLATPLSPPTRDSS